MRLNWNPLVKITLRRTGESHPANALTGVEIDDSVMALNGRVARPTTPSKDAMPRPDWGERWIAGHAQHALLWKASGDLEMYYP